MYDSILINSLQGGTSQQLEWTNQPLGSKGQWQQLSNLLVLEQGIGLIMNADRLTHGLCFVYNLGFVDILKSSNLYSLVANIHFQSTLIFCVCLYVHLYVSINAHVTWYSRGGQRTACRSPFSPVTM